jgi:hypothetical protein
MPALRLCRAWYAANYNGVFAAGLSVFSADSKPDGCGHIMHNEPAENTEMMPAADQVPFPALILSVGRNSLLVK